MKNDNTIFWILGLILLVVIISQVPIKFPFAIITTTVCQENVISYWNFNENTLDINGVNNAVNVNGTLINGKIELDGTDYINFPISVNNNLIEVIKDYSAGDTTYHFLARLNNINYVNGVQSSSKQIIPLSSTFGLNKNISVNEITYFSNLSLEQMLSIYNNGSIQPICYQTTTYENVTCKDYATEMVTDTGSGCLNYSGSVFPNCTYKWESSSQYKIENNLCSRYFYCQNPCLTTGNCYTTNQACTEKLNSLATTTTPPTSSKTLQDRLNSEIFEVGGYSVKLLHLIILFVAIALILYLTRKNA